MKRWQVFQVLGCQSYFFSLSASLWDLLSSERQLRNTGSEMMGHNGSKYHTKQTNSEKR
jgi:hypothetical protein